MDVFIGDQWKGGSVQNLAYDFGIPLSTFDGVEILLAYYSYEDYSGSAFVLFEKDGKLFEVNGGHCSCYGLSESNYSDSTGTQWQPEETTWESLVTRLKSWQFEGFSDELRALIEAPHA